MLHQQISELDFDTYFDVSSNNVQSAQQQQLVYDQSTQQQSIHPNQQLCMPRFPQLQYFMPQQQQQHQQPTFEMLDWCFKQQQQQQLQHSLTVSASHTPVTTPESANNNKTDYFYSTQQPSSACPSTSQINVDQNELSIVVKQEQLNYGFDSENNSLLYNMSSEATTSIATPTNNSGLPTPIPDIIYPGTPQSRNSSRSESNPPSPISSTNIIPQSVENSPPLVNAFAAIEQWGKNIDKTIPDCSKEEFHETRHWRKSTRKDSICSNTSNMVAAAVAAVAARSAPRGTPVEAGRQLKKVAHNAIERRYRNNINDRIRDLKNVVPALYKAKIREKKGSRCTSTFEDDESSDEECPAGEENNEEKAGEIVDGVEVAKKLNKATILHKATEYIHHLKHTNELARRENQVLQQILAQMPGGTKVLARFQRQKSDFEQAEQQRLLAERKESTERERMERQRMLRERAAHRAALAELLPKPERRPYRRRAKRQQPISKKNTTASSISALNSSPSTTASSPAGTPTPEEVMVNTESDSSYPASPK